MGANNTNFGTPRRTVADYLDAFADRLVLTFVDEDNSRTQDMAWSGETTLNHGGHSKNPEMWFVACGIHVKFLRALLSTTATMAERTLARFGFATAVSPSKKTIYTRGIMIPLPRVLFHR